MKDQLFLFLKNPSFQYLQSFDSFMKIEEGGKKILSKTYLFRPFRREEEEDKTCRNLSFRGLRNDKF